MKIREMGWGGGAVKMNIFRGGWIFHRNLKIIHRFSDTRAVQTLGWYMCAELTPGDPAPAGVRSGGALRGRGRTDLSRGKTWGLG